MVALPAITGKFFCYCVPILRDIHYSFFGVACLYGDLGSDDFVNALQQAKYLDILLDFTKDDWLHLLRQ
jgi:hypothetical protein